MMWGLVIARKMVNKPPTTVSAGIAIINQTQGLRNHGSFVSSLSCCTSVVIGRPTEAVFLDDRDAAAVGALECKFNDVTAI